MATTVEDVMSGVEEAFGRQDAAAAAQFWTEECQMLAPDVPLIQGRGGAQSLVEAMFAGGATAVKFHSIRLEDAGQLTLQVGQYVMTMRGDDGVSREDEGKYLSVYQRQPDGTVLISMTSFNRNAPSTVA